MSIKLKKGIFLGPNGNSVFLLALGELQNAELPIKEAQDLYVMAKALNEHMEPVQEHCKALAEKYSVGAQLSDKATKEEQSAHAESAAAYRADISQIVDIEFELNIKPVELPVSAWGLDPELKKLRVKSSVLGVLQENGVIVIT